MIMQFVHHKNSFELELSVTAQMFMAIMPFKMHRTNKKIHKNEKHSLQHNKIIKNLSIWTLT